MYAVIATGGKQYRVTPGEVLRLERIAAEPGASIELTDVRMVADGDQVRCGAAASGRRVVATMLRHGRGPKLVVFKKKKRKQFRRTRGHRQAFSEVRIDRIE